MSHVEPADSSGNQPLAKGPILKMVRNGSISGLLGHT